MTKLYFDLETIPDQSYCALDDARERVKVPKTYKKPEAIEKYKIDHGEEVWKKTGLAGISGEICSIAYAFDGGQLHSRTRGVDVDVDGEEELLLAFFRAIKEFGLGGQGEHQRLEWIGHNLIDFDLRFLKQRALILGIYPGFRIPSDARHGNGAVFDTMREWEGYRGYVKQSALQRVFNIQQHSALELLSGDQVAAFWAAERFKDIAAYNRDDVRVCREIYKRLTWA